MSFTTSAQPIAAASCDMRGRCEGSNAVASLRLTSASALRGSNMRGNLLTTSCLKCAAQQLFTMPKLQQQLQQQQQRQQCLSEEPALLLQRQASSAAPLSLRPAWAAAGSHTGGRRAASSPGPAGYLSMQQDAQLPASTGSSSSNNSVSSSGSSSSSSSSSSPGTPVITDMPPLAELLGDAAAGDTSSAQPSSRSPVQSPDRSVDSSRQQQQQPEQVADSHESPGVRAALALLRWYKGALSPLMASSCRFLPTCSQYSMDSYRAYGVSKGTVLTAWRLLRCNPWGPSGYDPTAWPPVGLAWLFRVEGSAEVAVVVGLAAFLRLWHALLFE